MYQGHLPNGNPVQQHSAGEIYPLVIMQKGLAPNEHYGILYGSRVYEVADSFKETEQIAQRIKENTAPCWYSEALDNYNTAFVYRKEHSTEKPVDPAECSPDVEFLEIRLEDSDLDDWDGVELSPMAEAYALVYDYIEAGAFLEEEVAGRMLKLSVHDNGMFLKDFRDDRFIFEIYPSLNTEATVAQIMWRLFPNEYVCNFAAWRGVVAAWLLHHGESVMNWQSLAFDTWQSAAYHEVKSWQDLCALLNAVTSKD